MPPPWTMPERLVRFKKNIENATDARECSRKFRKMLRCRFHSSTVTRRSRIFLQRASVSSSTTFQIHWLADVIDVDSDARRHQEFEPKSIPIHFAPNATRNNKINRPNQTS